MKTKKLRPGDPMRDGFIYVGRAYDDEKKQHYSLALSPRDEEGTYTFDEAVEKFGGDLPTKKEWMLIVGALPESFVPEGDYWSASVFSGTRNSAWVFYSAYGYVFVSIRNITFVVRSVKRFNYV